MNQSHTENMNHAADSSEQDEKMEQAKDNVEAVDAESQAEQPEAAEAAEGAAEGAADESNELQKQLEEARQQLEEAQQRWLRAQADFDNFRRRTRQEKEQLIQYASMNVLEQLLPVIDNFERAVASSVESKDFDSLAKGIDMVFRQMMGVLENEGLKPIDAVGSAFNPEVHQAVMQVESDEHEEGIVVEEVQKGYMLKEKVLRPSMVKVSS